MVSKIKSLLPLAMLACGANADQPDVANEGAVSDAPVEEVRDAVELRPVQLPAASEVSAQLGVDNWQFQGRDIYGFSVDGQVVAEFHTQPENGAIESVLPAAGFRKVDESANFPPEVAKYYDALAGDLRALAASGDPVALDVEKAVVECFLILDNCLFAASQRRVLFGQSCTCSLNVGECGIILPLGLDCG